MKSLKFSYGIQLIKPKYITLQIKADKGLRNYKNIDIARTINKTYKAISKRIRIEQKKLIIETSFKISYVVDIEKTGVNFYFIVPEVFKEILINQISNVWHKAEIKEVEGVKEIPTSFDLYQMYYKNEDALSLKVDKKNNEPLNSILNVINIMEHDDRVTLFYNFMPNPNLGFKHYYDDIMAKYKNNELLEKQDYSMKLVVKKVALNTVSILQSIIDVLNDFLGNKRNSKDEKSNIYKMLFSILNEKKELSNTTKAKKEDIILDTQIVMLSASNDFNRKYNNAQAVYNSFNQLEEDNTLKIRKFNTKEFNPYVYDLKVKVNKVSVQETHNFIQLPGKALLNEYKIEHININEVPLEEELKVNREDIKENGMKVTNDEVGVIKKEIGIVSYKGKEETAYYPTDYNLGNLPLYIGGGQNAGKTTILKRYARDCIEAGEGVICIDFIKNCELAKSIESITPKDRLIKLDLSEEHKQGFSYNEYKIDKTDTRKMIKKVKQQAQQIETLIDSINFNDPLSPRMGRFLNAAAIVAILNDNNSIKGCIDVLENFKLREIYIKNVLLEYPGIENYLSSEIASLEELDEWSSGKRDNPPEKIGNKDSKIDFILDRVSSLRKDFSLQEMYENTGEDNIDLLQAMEEGKVVLILMNEADFNTVQVKNVITTYFISKIWVASQIRGQLHEKPLRSNTIIDEVFQAPTCLNTLRYILPQSRKFGTKFILSGHYLTQLKEVADTLKACNSNYKLGNGISEKDFIELKQFISDDWTYDDIKEMGKWYFFNIIQTSKGVSNFINEPIAI